MGKRKSDALTALIHEQVDIEADYDDARKREEEASQESIAARQVLDAAIDNRKLINQRLEHTKEAIGILKIRDEISTETVAALLDRERTR